MEGAPPVLFGKKPKAGSQKRETVGGSISSWVVPRPKWGARGRSRSRSPFRAALPGLRVLAPGRRERRRAASPDLDNEQKRQEALRALDLDKKASSTHVSDTSRIAIMEGWLRQWGLNMFPPSVASFKAIVATLKAGFYKSAPVYLQVYRTTAERRGYDISPLIVRDLKDYKRSCLRGLGGPVRPRPLLLESLGSLPAQRGAWVEGGPINPRAAVLAGSWWLCREVELASTRARLLELLVPPGGKPSARWHLPASKSDTEAVGMARTLHCCCEVVGLSSCPAHCLWDHLCFLERTFPAKFVGVILFGIFPFSRRQKGRWLPRSR